MFATVGPLRKVFPVCCEFWRNSVSEHHFLSLLAPTIRERRSGASSDAVFYKKLFAHGLRAPMGSRPCSTGLCCPHPWWGRRYLNAWLRSQRLGMKWDCTVGTTSVGMMGLPV